MTEDQIKKLCLEAFNEGQLKGIELAFDLLIKMLPDFKEKFLEDLRGRLIA